MPAIHPNPKAKLPGRFEELVDLMPHQAIMDDVHYDHTTDMIDRRDYGRLEAEVAQLVKAVATLQADVATMREMMQQARGGWRAIAFVGGISSTITAGVLWVISHVQFIR